MNSQRKLIRTTTASFLALALLPPAADADDELDALFKPQAQEDSAPPQAVNPVEVIELPAGEDEAPTRPAPRSGLLEEIIVTAEKREASLQDTPISMAALTEEKLELAGISGLDSLGANVPNLQIEPFPTNNATLKFYIRGIGIIDPQITQDPAVGIYLDGVYIARSTGTALDIADLERIEVLRGPQGTLYGRNTTGGAINLITQKPDNRGLRFKQTITLGNFASRQAKTSLNIPLADQLAAKIGLLYSKRDGYVENTGPGGDFGDREQTGVRFDLRYSGWSSGMIDYSFDYSDSTQWNYMYQAVLTPESNKGPTEQIKREAQANTVYSTRMLRSLATGVPLEASGTRIMGHALTLAGDVNDLLGWKYIGAYRDLVDGTYTDLGGGAGSTRFRVDTGAYDGPAALLANGGELPAVINVLSQDQQSHEFQLTGSLTQDGAFDLVAGLFWFSEQGLDDWPLHHQFSGALNPDASYDISGPVFSALGPRLINIVDIRNSIDNEAIAAYGQLGWRPNLWEQRLRLTFGYRFSQDKRRATKTRITTNYLEYQQDGQGVAAPITAPGNTPSNPITDLLFGNVSLLNVEQFDNVPAARKDRDHSISLVAEWAQTDDINIYAKYVEAYKGGGFNTRDPQSDGVTRPAPDGVVYGFGFSQGFAPEYVSSIELGLKSELFGRLRANGNLFYSQYRDMQVNFLVPGTVSDTKTANAGRSRMYGLEMDAEFAVNSDLFVSGSYAYLNAEITKVISQANGEDVTDQFQFPSAPKHSFSLSGDWTLMRRPWGSLAVHLGYNFVDLRRGGATTGKLVTLPAYGVLNTRLMARDLVINKTNVSLALWARNLLDEEYEINAIDNLPQADRAVIWGSPCSFGVDFSLSF